MTALVVAGAGGCMLVTMMMVPMVTFINGFVTSVPAAGPGRFPSPTLCVRIRCSLLFFLFQSIEVSPHLRQRIMLGVRRVQGRFFEEPSQFMVDCDRHVVFRHSCNSIRYGLGDFLIEDSAVMLQAMSHTAVNSASAGLVQWETGSVVVPW
jgi:hypothetical protein